MIQTEDVAVHESIGEDVVCEGLVGFLYSTMEYSISSSLKQQVEKLEALGKRGGWKPTVLKRFWNREPALANDVELDLVELLAFDAGAYRDALFGVGEAFAQVCISFSSRNSKCNTHILDHISEGHAMPFAYLSVEMARIACPVHFPHLRHLVPFHLRI